MEFMNERERGKESPMSEEDEIIQYYKTQGAAREQAVLVELLRELQELYGCIPFDLQQKIAAALNMKETVITKIIKLFPSLTLAPRRRQITLCAGASCSARGSGEVAAAVRKLLYGGCDKNGRVGNGLDACFTLVLVGCMKRCADGVNMAVDEDLYHHVTPEQVPEILGRYIPG